MKPIIKTHIEIISARTGGFHHKSQWQKEIIRKVGGEGENLS